MIFHKITGEWVCGDIVLCCDDLSVGWGVPEEAYRLYVDVSLKPKRGYERLELDGFGQEAVYLCEDGFIIGLRQYDLLKVFKYIPIRFWVRIEYE